MENLENFKIKTGKVVEINADYKRVRVKDSLTKLVSPWLQLVMPVVQGSISFSPAINDQVVYFEFDEKSGFVVGRPLSSSDDNGEEKKVSFSVGSNSLVWDLDSGNLTVTAPEIVIAGDTVKLGSSATEPAVLGDTLKSLLENVLSALNTHVHGDGTPAANAAIFETYSLQLSTILASKTKVE